MARQVRWHITLVDSGVVDIETCRYRKITPKAHCIPLTAPFLAYLRADGIVLPPEPTSTHTNGGSAKDDWNNDTFYDSSDSSDNDLDPSTPWADLHATITSTIASFGGHVTPKLNWSAPKDATWINATNSMDCTTANDVYLLLKSSDFITHDLEHAFDGCVDDLDISHDSTTADEDEANEAETEAQKTAIPYHLILRKWLRTLHPSLEFRCFVRSRSLLALTQRDLNHYPFLLSLRPQLTALISAFYDRELRDTFPDPDFVFDVYVPPSQGVEGTRYERVRLVDVNPWAARTDPILFSWGELLGMEDPGVGEEDEHGEDDDSGSGSDDTDELEHAGVVRIPFRPRPRPGPTAAANANKVNGESGQTATNGKKPSHHHIPATASSNANASGSSNSNITSTSNATTSPPLLSSASHRPHRRQPAQRPPELRLISSTDPEATKFSTQQYSAHKMPRDVVDAASAASAGGGDGGDLEGLRSFAEEWRKIVERREKGGSNSSSGSSSDSDEEADDDDKRE